MVGPIAISIVFVMELTLVPFLLPAIQLQLDLSIAQLAWVLNAYSIAVAVGVLIGGWLGDLLSSRRVFVAGVLLFALGSIVVSVASSFEAILVGRVVQGLGGGVFSPLVPVLLIRASPDRPGRMLIIWGSFAGYVAAFAPLAFSHAPSDYGWQSAFVVFAVISSLALMSLLGTSVGDQPIAETRPAIRLSALLRSNDLWLLYAYVFCTYGSFTFFLFRLPLWMSEIGKSAPEIGATLSMVWLSFSIISTVLRNRVDGPQVRYVLTAAPILIAAGFPLAYYSASSAMLFVSAALVGSGLACSNAPSTQLILKHAPERANAIAASLDITFARLGGVLTVALLAKVTINSAVTSVIGLCLVSLLVCQILCNREPQQPRT